VGLLFGVALAPAPWGLVGLLAPAGGVCVGVCFGVGVDVGVAVEVELGFAVWLPVRDDSGLGVGVGHPHSSKFFASCGFSSKALSVGQGVGGHILKSIQARKMARIM